MNGQFHAPGVLGRVPSTHRAEGWMELRAGLDALEKREYIYPLPGAEARCFGRPACSLGLEGRCDESFLLVEHWYLLDFVKRTRRCRGNLLSDRQMCRLGRLVIIVVSQHFVMNCLEYFRFPPRNK